MPVNMNIVSGPEYQARREEEKSSEHEMVQNERMRKRAEEMVDSDHELAVEIRNTMEDGRGYIGLNEEEIGKLAESGYDRELIKMIAEEVEKKIVH
jgi:hypothetical protein